MTDELVEAVARAICEGACWATYDLLAEDEKEIWREFARAAIEAYEAVKAKEAKPMSEEAKMAYRERFMKP